MDFDIKNLTLEEKFKLLTGKTYWDLENANGKLYQVVLADGPHGLRKPDKEGKTMPATAMPTLSCLASTWDRELAYLDASTIADDCIEQEADVLLAPGVNIKRTPFNGRNMEYFSEDPFLAGELSKQYILGLQDKGIGTSLKHYCLNNSEFDRFFLSSEIDERTLREIYLPAFEKAIEAKPWTIMSSYNQVNGIYAPENKKILNDILREQLGFDGLIVSDWSSVCNRARSVKASLDLEMPYREEAYSELKKAYDDGYITDEDIDKCVTRIVELIEKVQKEKGKRKIEFSKEERHQNAVEVARGGIVLLKNEDNILPLKSENIFVGGIYEKKNLVGGAGSARAISDYEIKPLSYELNKRLQGKATVYSGGAMYRMNNQEIVMKIKADMQKAYSADAVVLSMGHAELVEGENYDRETLRLNKKQEKIILDVASINPNTIVIVSAGSAVDMSAWIDKVKAVVLLGYAGEGGQEALADILSGKISPSGKLAETFPLNIEDTPFDTYKGDNFVDNYKEGIFVGYRYYEKEKKQVQFPFGHGLSYADFEYSNLRINKNGDADFDIMFDIENKSEISAKEVAQIYVKDIFSQVARPEKELKGFEKICLKAGEKKTVKINLGYRAFAFYSTMLDDWHIENGEFEIQIGSSSKDIRLKGKIDINLAFENQYSAENPHEF